MKRLPETEHSMVLRTDYSDDTAWEAVCKAIGQVDSEFQSYVDFVNSPEYDGIGVEQVISAMPQNSYHAFVFVIDRTTLLHPEYPVLCIDLDDEPGRTFRVIPAELPAVENNLSLANMDFFEFAYSVDQDGIFRGFPRM